MTRLIAFVVLTVLANCTGFEPEPVNSPESNFELFWKDFDELYTMFEFQDYDWDSVYRACRPGVDAHTSSDSLFRMFKAMVKPFRDGHIYLSWKERGLTYAYPLEAANFINRAALVKQVPDLKDLGPYAYGHLNSNIGYILVKSFDSGAGDFSTIDSIMEGFDGTRALVVDVRVNGGGSTSNSDLVASRFADETRVAAYIRWKAGKAHNAFTDYLQMDVSPHGVTWTKPVLLLTGRSTFSAAEDFVCRMKVMPHVTLMGAPTGGGSGNPMRRYLPNGMTFNVPRWIEYDAEKTPYERKGIPPDVAVPLTETDRQNQRDAVLVAASTWIQTH